MIIGPGIGNKNIIFYEELNERNLMRMHASVKFCINISFTGRGMKEYGFRFQQMIQTLQSTFDFVPSTDLNISTSSISNYKGKIYFSEIDVIYKYRSTTNSMEKVYTIFSSIFEFFPINKPSLPRKASLLIYKVQQNTLILTVSGLNDIFSINAIGAKTKRLSYFLNEDHLIIEITPVFRNTNIEMRKCFLNWANKYLVTDYFTIIEEDKPHYGDDINELFEDKIE